MSAHTPDAVSLRAVYAPGDGILGFPPDRYVVTAPGRLYETRDRDEAMRIFTRWAEEVEA